MASQPPQAPQLPMFYKSLEPLSSNVHAKFATRGAETMPDLAKTHAVPVTVDEFAMIQRFFPIVFSIGDNPVPLALMGLNEGVNTAFDADGKLINEMYVPAYIRRYPFMLARISEQADELSLCFDAESGLVGEYEDGNALFDADGKPTETTNGILKFCEEFEMSAQKTGQFVAELKELGLLMDGELTIQTDGMQPAVYRGFQMVDENKLRDMTGDELRKINQNGMLPLLYAHLMSLPLAREIFAKQVAQGKMPEPAPVAAPEPATEQA